MTPTACLVALLGFLSACLRLPKGCLQNKHSYAFVTSQGPLHLRALLLKQELGAASPAPVGVPQQLACQVPTSRHGLVLAQWPGGGPPLRATDPGSLLAFACANSGTLQAAERGNRMFWKLGSHPVPSGNTPSGRLCRSGKLTESAHYLSFP